MWIGFLLPALTFLWIELKGFSPFSQDTTIPELVSQSQRGGENPLEVARVAIPVQHYVMTIKNDLAFESCFIVFRKQLLWLGMAAGAEHTSKKCLGGSVVSFLRLYRTARYRNIRFASPGIFGFQHGSVPLLSLPLSHTL